ncbi:MAG: class I tRNA ligase family protein, partial [Pseudorhodobacter sp.]|nr:class I tRNA ligase family protein [Rhizobacter sp.]
FTVDGSGRKMSKSLGNYMPLAESAQKYGGEILRLWCASTDYSGDLSIDDKILARVVDSYRRIRNTLRFLLANTSDFNPHADAVSPTDMLEIDCWALAKSAYLQSEILAHYEVYEFHPVVSKLQVFCSEDLGAFYLDVLKDRLYTTAPNSRARRSAQTALWHISQTMLRWMAPFLSFTAEEAWKVVGAGHSGTIFTETYSDVSAWVDNALLAKWARVREVREAVNKEIETVRAAGSLGSSLQADITITLPEVEHAVLASLGDDLKFVTITSTAELLPGNAVVIAVKPSTSIKCERCWHYREDVGTDPAHPTICGRCTSNLYGAGEHRTVA